MFHSALVLFAVEVRRGFGLYKFESKDVNYHITDSNFEKGGGANLISASPYQSTCQYLATTLTGRTSAEPATLMALQR